MGARADAFICICDMYVLKLGFAIRGIPRQRVVP